PDYRCLRVAAPMRTDKGTDSTRYPLPAHPTTNSINFFYQYYLLTAFRIPDKKCFPLSGNNSVVECNLAKVEVAGSNPVSRSKIFKGQIDDLALFCCLIVKQNVDVTKDRKIIRPFRFISEFSPKNPHTGRKVVSIRTSPVRVRCTGHRPAISSKRCRCASSSSPLSSTSRSMLSIWRFLSGQSRQSSA